MWFGCSGKPWSVLLFFVCPQFQCMQCLQVLNSQVDVCSACVFEQMQMQMQMKIKKKCMCGHFYVIHGTSFILERLWGLQGERADPLHHHYHYHHQSSFEWHSWIRQCIEPLARPHLDITFERKRMEGEKGLKERMIEGQRGCGRKENTSGSRATFKEQTAEVWYK